VAYGAVAAAGGQDAQAIAAFRRMLSEEGHCRTCGALEMAEAFERLGERDSALVYYEAIAKTPTLDATRYVDYFALPTTLKRLGELYEARGDQGRAVEYYGRFVELWKNADPELQPKVADVRRRLAQLRGSERR
jgi:tetratricopeptide (TPR) repeat protein